MTELQKKSFRKVGLANQVQGRGPGLAVEGGGTGGLAVEALRGCLGGQGCAVRTRQRVRGEASTHGLNPLRPREQIICKVPRADFPNPQ